MVRKKIETTNVEVPVVEETKSVFFEGSHVVEVIDTLVPNFRHCKMEDGTTRHVPEELFN